MIDYKKYLKVLKGTKFSELVCTHCGAATKSPKGKKAICNFCEQETGSEKELRAGAGFLEEFQRMHTALADSKGKGAFANIEKLLEESSDPEAFYVSATFYLLASEQRYRSRDYSLPGFMEENYDNIRGSLDLTSKWKEHLYRAAALAGLAPEAGAQNRELLYLRFISEVKLHRLADASLALVLLMELDGKDPLLGYASMVYGVRARTKDAELRLAAELETKEANAYYYLAEHLARNGRLAEAEEVLVQLESKADVRMSAHLLGTIRNVRDASRM
jgi:hypothetical protein